MRKNKKLIAFTVFVVIAVSIACSVIIKKTKQRTLVVTDADGVSYVAVFDGDNNKYVVVTDAAGAQYAAPFDGSKVNMEATFPLQEKFEGTFPYNETKRADNININQNNNEMTSMTGEPQTKPAESQPPQTNESTQSQGESASDTTENQPKEYMSDKFVKLFNSNIFTMTFTTDDEEMGEVTMAMQNSKVSMDVTMEGIKARAVIDTQNGTGFLVIPQLRVYCALPEDMAQDLNTAEFGAPDVNEAEKADVFDVTIDGKECVCEEFTYEDGSVRAYYFYNGNLIRMVMIDDGETSLFNISSLSSEVDHTLFETPKGYIKIDLSKLQLDE